MDVCWDIYNYQQNILYGKILLQSSDNEIKFEEIHMTSIVVFLYEYFKKATIAFALLRLFFPVTA